MLIRGWRMACSGVTKMTSETMTKAAGTCQKVFLIAGRCGRNTLGTANTIRHRWFFSEQAAHWNWCADNIHQFQQRHNRHPRILNLFAYSGLASLHAAAAGAEVTHVDASKKAIAQAFENRDACGLQDTPIRFITDDAIGFVAREIRRRRTYDGIIMDPPKYGRGPKGETWRLEGDLRRLLGQANDLLSGDALFLVLTIYAIRLINGCVSALDAFKERPGSMKPVGN